MPTPLGSTPATAVPLSSNSSINSLVYGIKWYGAPGTKVALSYSFRSSDSYYAISYTADNEYQNSYQLTANQKTAVTKALGTWAAVANISFSQTVDSNTHTGDLRFGGYAGMESGTAAWAYLPGSQPAAGDVWIGPGTSAANPVAGTYDYLTFIHEIGHALGLKHPFESANFNFTVLGAAYDDVRYTVMSYTDPYSYEPTTPMLFDIAAIQYLYGANMKWRTGNDTYQWAAGQRVFETIWDAGGIDTLNASNQTQGVTLNLNPGTFSKIGATFWSGTGYINNGLAIAYGAQIEHAVGSAYADTLIGNALANTLNGNAGNDTLSGGLGNDVLIGAAGADRLLGGDGSDLYYVDSTGDSVSETNALVSTGGTDTVYSYLAAYTLGSNLESLRLLSTGAANGTGNSLNNLINAGAGKNILNGGAGIDTLSYAYATGAVTASLATTAAQATGGSGSDTLLNFENLTGSNYNDRLTGNAAANTLSGGAGIDILTGGAGNDTLNGGAGNDTLNGGVGNDLLIAGTGVDRLYGGSGADRFDFNVASEMGLGVLRDVLGDFKTGEGDKIDLSTLDANLATTLNDAFKFIGSSVFSGNAAGQLRFANGMLYGSTDADVAAEFEIQLLGVSSLKSADLIA